MIKKTRESLSGYIFFIMPTRLAVGLRQKDLSQCYSTFAPGYFVLFGFPVSFLPFGRPLAKKKLGYFTLL
jgi:hypothetical protein